MTQTAPKEPGTGTARRHWKKLAALGVVILLVAGIQYVRSRYYVMGILRTTTTEWLTIHTNLYVASSAEISEQIEAAPFARSDGLDTGPAAGPLEVLDSNPRYFTDGTGRAVFLTGSHTWANFQDGGNGYPPPSFDFEQYLDFMEAHAHNFFRLWVWEGARWAIQTSNDDYWFHPMGPFVRSGPGTALDGMPKWDLSRFDQAYFDRLRERVRMAGDRGIYVAVMLFQGFSVARVKGRHEMQNPWRGHPFHRDNNVDGVDGDLDGDESGEEIHELGDADVLRIQEAYVRKVIDTVNDLDNVLYEISNESHRGSEPWQYHIVDFIHDYQATKPQQHPVGMTVTYPGGDDSDLLTSNADWISPNSYQIPPPSDGSKVVLADTDHIWGIGGDRAWVWMSLTRGVYPVFMDGYDGAAYGIGGKKFDFDDPQWIDLRRNMGYARAYARRIDLSTARPTPDACSTGFCLTSGSSDRDTQLVIFTPEGGEVTVDLSGQSGNLRVEWLDPSTGGTQSGTPVAAGAAVTLTSPFIGDAVLLLHR